MAYVFEDEGPSLKRYGFAIGTLPGHVERGEERFTVGWHATDDSVFYEVSAFARPAHTLVKAASGLARLIQRWFAVDSLHSMVAVARGGTRRQRWVQGQVRKAFGRGRGSRCKPS